jgi:hypothetical protein
LKTYNSFDIAVANAAVPSVKKPVFERREVPGRASIKAAAAVFGSGVTLVAGEALLSGLEESVDWKRRE